MKDLLNVKYSIDILLQVSSAYSSRSQMLKCPIIIAKGQLLYKAQNSYPCLEVPLYN